MIGIGRVVFSLLSLFVYLWLAADSQAHAKTIGRIQILPNDEAIVGGRLTVAIDVLTNEGWAKLARTPVIELPGALTFVPPSQASRISDIIEGESYTGSRTEIWLFPLQPGTLTVPPMEVEVLEQSFGAESEKSAVAVQLDGAQVNVRAPNIAESEANGGRPERIPVTNSLKLSQMWSEVPDELFVGDGITRTVVQEADGIPALLLEPVDFTDIAFTEVARLEPKSDNQFNRGSLTSSRTDSATYLFNAPGKVSLPRIQVQWIDSANGELRTATVEGRELEVRSKSLTGQDTMNQEVATDQGWSFYPIAIGIAALAILGVTVVLAYRTFGQNYNTLTDAAALERRAFREIKSAIREADKEKSLAAVYAWAFQVVPNDESVHNWLATHADTSRNLELLEQSAASRAPFKHGHALLRDLTAARRSNRLTKLRHSHRSPLPPLRVKGSVR